MAAPLPDPADWRDQIEQARRAATHGRAGDAVAAYRAVHERIEAAHLDAPGHGEDPSGEARLLSAQALVGLASAEFELSGDLEAALGRLAAAEDVAARAGAPGSVAAVRGQRGLLLLRSGHRHRALAAFDAAAEVAEAADRVDRVSILLNRGVLHLDIGSLHRAEDDFRACERIAEESADSLLTWKARHNLGYADFLAGRLPRALAAMERAAGELGDLDDHLVPIGLLDRARVLREAGLVADATVLLEQAAQRLRAAGLTQDEGETDLVLAECALVQGDPARARQLASDGEQLFARRGNPLWQRRAQLLVLHCDRATASDEQLATVARRAHDLAERCRREGRLDLARPADLLARECRLRSGPAPGEHDRPPRVRPSEPLRDRLLVREVRALHAVRRGDPRRAAAEVGRGLRELGSYQSGFGSLDLRTASAVHGLPLARLGVDLALQRGRAVEVFAAVERARAFSTRLARVGPPHDERTAGLLTDLRRVDEEARALEGDPAGHAELVLLWARARALQRDLRGRAWELEASGEGADLARVVPAAARVAPVRAEAQRRGCELVCFAAHRGRILAVVASRRRPVLLDLADAAEVDELVRRTRADLDALALAHLPPALLDAVGRSLRAGLARLDGLLVEPLAVGAAPLVVSCGAPLMVLPWSLLPSRRGRSVVVTPSASAWLRAGSHPRPRLPRVVAVAGPGLRRAGEEAQQVRAAWPSARLLSGEQATGGAVQESLSGADVVHVGAHGTHQQQSPLFSSLRLRDGPLFAYELDPQAGAAGCVVLSACETGLASVRPGDVPLGLTSVLLHLGSRCVLAGVGRVRDDAAARVMVATHAAMAAGTDSGTALAGALAAEEVPSPFVAFGAAW